MSCLRSEAGVQHLSKLWRIAWFGVVSLAPWQITHGQDFVNLDFEEALVPPTPVGQYGPLSVAPELAFPGWTVGPAYTPYNNITLGSAAQVLIGPEFPNALGISPLQGLYSALLMGETTGYTGTQFLSQTGLVPLGARSITFLSSGTLSNNALVTINGLNITVVPIGGGRFAGDVTAFAGSEALLMFRPTGSFGAGWLYFDDITFSPIPIPEPSVFWLAFTGVLVLAPLVRGRLNPA